MGGSIIAIIRSVMQGQTISNNVGQSSAAPDVDIKSMIETAINSRLIIIESEVNGLRIDRHIEKTDGLLIEKLQTDLAIAHNRIDDLDKKIAAISSEATAPAKKPALSDERESVSSVEPESLPIIEAIANIAAPTVEKSFDEMLQVLAIQKTEIKALSGAQNQTQFDYVKQRIFEQTGEIWEWEGAPKDGKWVKVNDAIAATAKPKSTKRSPKSKAILSRPEALAIAKKSGFNGTGQNLYDWAKAALTAKSEESKLSNRDRLAAVGLVAVFTPENKPAWQAKTPT